MATFIMFYHSGVVITNDIGSYEFVEMKNETFLLNEFLTLVNVVRLARERFNWMDEGCEVWFKGHIDIRSSNGARMTLDCEIEGCTIFRGELCIEEEERMWEGDGRSEPWRGIGQRASPMLATYKQSGAPVSMTSYSLTTTVYVSMEDVNHDGALQFT
jgi:hypothetical protein